MVSKNQKKLIKSLYQKKYRKQHGLFIAEGKKVVKELLEANMKLHSVFMTADCNFDVAPSKIYRITEEELKSISFLTTAQVVLAVFHIPETEEVDVDGIVLALDDVRDPGNLGTIIRLCDWFGVTNLICSQQTVDCYNPKVIQATMGSITRVSIIYTDLVVFLQKYKDHAQIFGTFMDGDNIHQAKLPKTGVVVMGNEANGISEAIKKEVTNRITIPRFGQKQVTESLNVATATAIVLNEFRR